MISSAVAQIKTYKEGYFFSDEFRGDNSWNGNENNVLLRNTGLDENGVPRFVDVAVAVGADDGKDARGVSVADFDNDGDLDIVVNNNPGIQSSNRPTLLMNKVGQDRNWLAVELEGTTINRSAVGSTVRLKIMGGERNQRPMILTRQVTAGSSYASQRSDRLYFGLGDHEFVQELSVDWIGSIGDDFEMQNVQGNRLLKITQGAQNVEVINLSQLARDEN